ncbi:hypothetical protein [Arthrobacter koreensis]|uniref:hypothetical protein n=1 Tax=Arthrobacter TaxID=1663 RepID=UPI000B87589C|nr:hypothetical protein [Arthrobacter koreensis]
MEIFFTLLVLGLLAGVTAVVVFAIRHDGRGHLPPVSSGRPWHGNALWDVADPRDLSLDRPFLPRH